ncbi:hypothetical protein BGZ83_001680 [Gryganskiella cystojenkinii]|nr:hypothetical protein BGZ83_001680 [Gryganskiella cystojenkinii]
MQFNHLAPTSASDAQHYADGSFSLFEDNSSSNKNNMANIPQSSIDAEPWIYPFEQQGQSQPQRQNSNLSGFYSYTSPAPARHQPPQDGLLTPPQVLSMDMSKDDSVPDMTSTHPLDPSPLGASTQSIDSQQYSMMMNEATSRVLSLASSSPLLQPMTTTLTQQQQQLFQRSSLPLTTGTPTRQQSYHLQLPQIALRRADSTESFVSSSPSFHSASCSPMITSSSTTVTAASPRHWMADTSDEHVSNCGSSAHGISAPNTPLILSPAPLQQQQHLQHHHHNQQQQQQDYFFPVASSPAPNTLRPYASSSHLSSHMTMDLLTTTSTATSPPPASSPFQSPAINDYHQQQQQQQQQFSYDHDHNPQSQRTQIPVPREGFANRHQQQPPMMSSSLSSSTSIPYFSSDSLSSMSTSGTSISSVPSSPMMPGLYNDCLMLSTNACAKRRPYASTTSGTVLISNTKKMTNGAFSPVGRSRRATTAAAAGSPNKVSSATTASATKRNKARYVCQIPNCHRTFSRPFNLKSHGLTHETQRPHACGICPKTFARIHDRDRHRKGHLIEKAHSCVVCLGRFARQDAVTRHLKLAGGQNPCSIILNSRGLSFRDAAAGRVSRGMLGDDEEGIRRLLERLEEQNRRARANRNLEAGMMTMNMQMHMALGLNPNGDGVDIRHGNGIGGTLGLNHMGGLQHVDYSGHQQPQQQRGGW